MTDSLPRLSIVVTSRNDDHGGEMLKRMTIFIKGLLHQTRKHDLQIELVFVEWNPAAGKPLLNEVLPKPQPGDKLSMRYIVVPNRIHQRYKRGVEIPLFQMIAKNIGIRRAKSDWILCSNVDLLFSDKLMLLLKKGGFGKKSYYRANRCDIPNKLEADWPTEAALAYSEKNIIKRLGEDSRFLYVGDWPHLIPRNRLTLWMIDTANYLRLKYLYDAVQFKLRPLDAEACGDFTMMHREGWLDIKGYLELDLYSLHIDTFALMMALTRDYKQVILDPYACIYHIEHNTGWESMNPIEKIKFWEQRPGLAHDFIWEAAKFMLYRGKTFYVNDDNWGMPQENFEEIILSPPN